MKIDRNSLADVFRTMFTDEELSCIDPCLVYDESDGTFSICSNLVPKSETEHVIAKRLCDTWLADDASMVHQAIEERNASFIEGQVKMIMESMDDDYIIGYIIGDIDQQENK